LLDQCAGLPDGTGILDGTPVPANRGESWRTVLIMAKDRHPLTRATMVALGEVLTGHGCIAIFAPVDAPSFPMGVNRSRCAIVEDRLSLRAT